jgi:cysteinyl-tRNA synthetase
MEAVARIAEFAHRLEMATGGTLGLAECAREAEEVFRRALDDDLNAPEALAALFSFLQRANSELDRGGSDTAPIEEARRVFALMDGVLDLQPRAVRVVVRASGATPDPATLSGLSEEENVAVMWAVDRLLRRVEARRERDFATSDSIRKEVEARGFLVKDTAEGTVLERYH